MKKLDMNDFISDMQKKYGTGLSGDNWEEHKEWLDVCEEHTFGDLHIVMGGSKSGE